MFFPPQRVIKVSLTSERNTIITLHSSVTLFYFIQSHLKFVFLKEKEQVSLKGQVWRGPGDPVRVGIGLGLQVGRMGEPRAWHEQGLEQGRGQVRCQCLGTPWALCLLLCSSALLRGFWPGQPRGSAGSSHLCTAQLLSPSHPRTETGPWTLAPSGFMCRSAAFKLSLSMKVHI